MHLERSSYPGCHGRGLATLDALGEVAEVEEVVRLGWGREEVLTHALVDLHGGIDD